MGNKGSESKKQAVQEKSKFVMKVTNQKIILHEELNMSLTIGGLEVFPHGLDGLKLWDAGIILTRYIIKNHDIFKNKQVLQLGSGVGISGIAVKKWTECSKIVLTDYHPSIIDNITKNCSKNNEKEIETAIFDWRDHEKYNEYKFDLIIGSDIVYFGCPVQELYEIFKKCLNPGGRGIIIIPDRKNYAELFATHIEKFVFDVQIQELEEEFYHRPVLEDKEESQKQYSLLGKIKFNAFILIKKSQNDQ